MVAFILTTKKLKLWKIAWNRAVAVMVIVAVAQLLDAANLMAEVGVKLHFFLFYYDTSEREEEQLHGILSSQTITFP